MPVKIYLAARYSRRLELCGYAETLRSMGYEITSRWLKGADEATRGEQSEAHIALAASQNLQDLTAADWCISFTELPRSKPGQGSRHVEFGVAYATEKRTILIGPLENACHRWYGVEAFETWEDFRDGLKEWAKSTGSSRAMA